MTSRERMMMIFLAVLAIGGIGYVAFTMLINPILGQNTRIRGLNGDITDKQFQLDVDQNKNKRLKTLLPLTLPANRELAEGEYETMLGRLFRECKISGGKYSKQTQSETDAEPELTPGTPGKPGKKAFQKVNYSISFDKVTLAKFTEFLERYYRVPLMHQIVKCSIKHSVSSTAPAFKSPTGDDRNDLTVSLVTEVVLLDGAPERKTLFAIPDTFGAVLGGVALNAIRNDTEKARYLTPTPDPAYYALAEMKRDYTLLAARDVFHGPLPEYPKWVPPPIPPGPKVEPPPYDSSPFVYLSSLVQSVEGGTRRAQLDIMDRYYDQKYEVEFEQFGELFEIKVQRFYREVKSDPKTKETTILFRQDRAHPRGAIFELSDRAVTPKAIRTFKIHGLIDNSVILSKTEKIEAPKADPRAKGKQPKVARPAPLPRPDAKMVAGGGLFALKAPTVKVYRWEFGQSLKQLEPLTKTKAAAALALAEKGLSADPPPPPPPPPSAAPGLEEAPFPRVPLK